VRQGPALVQFRTAPREEICRIGEFLTAIVTELGRIRRGFLRYHGFLYGLLDNRTAWGGYEFGFRFHFLHNPPRRFLHRLPDGLLLGLAKGLKGPLHGNFHRRLDFRFPDRGRRSFRCTGDFPVIIRSHNLAFHRLCNLPYLRSPGRGYDFRLGFWFGLLLRLFLRDLIRGEGPFYRGLLFMVFARFSCRLEFLPLDWLCRRPGGHGFFFLRFRSRPPGGGFFWPVFFMEQRNPFIYLTGTVHTVLDKDQFHGLDLIILGTD